MRHLKILFLAIGSLALCIGAAVAGMNPNDFGLAGGLTIYTPTESRICIDCHSRIPGAAAMNGTHFVSANGATHDTRTGGGWAGSKNGVRNNAGYFRVNQWPVGGTYSKYGGNAADNNSYFTAPANGAGLGLNAAVGTFVDRELICESCHNLVLHVNGGNNLVAPLTVAAYTANTGDNVQVQNWQNSDEATLCVGCHGFMYTATPTSPQQGRFADTRNNIDGGVVKRDNNHQHYINAVAVPQNHHVMTGDQVTSAIAGAGLLWRDTYVIDNTTTGWASGSETVTTTPTANQRGTMPQLAVWTNDGGKVKGGAANMNCLHCHSAPHSGDVTAGASILRDTNSLATGRGAATAIEKIGEGNRVWMGINDFNYCNDCHTLK